MCADIHDGQQAWHPSDTKNTGGFAGLIQQDRSRILLPFSYGHR
jgi:hypothetical protein